MGITLRAHTAPLRLPGRTIWGAWDPLRRHIDIYACHPGRLDHDLVRTLLHEWAHAQCAARDEAAAARTAGACLARYSESEVRNIAARLRERAA